MTLEDVTVELKNINTNIVTLKSETTDTKEYLSLTNDTLINVKEAIVVNTSVFKEGFQNLVTFFEGKSLKEIEEKREKDAFNKKLLNALEQKNTENQTETPKEKKTDDDSPLPGILSGLAVAIGTIVGVVKAQIEAAKLFTSNFFKLVKIIGTSITGFVKALTPKFIIDAITTASKSFGSKVSKSVSGFGASIVEKIANIKNTITTAVSNIGMAIRSKVASLFVGLSMQFDILKMSIMDSKVFKGIADIVKSFFKPFKELFTMIKGAITTVQTTSTMFANISSNLSKFAGFLGKVIGVVSKIFLPLTIIMTLWDTVKGMFEGFEKEGIVGGIKGAITGLFNSLIFGPLDLIKSAISWVLGFFGFEKAEAILDSFSFEDTFTKIIDALFYPFKLIQDAVVGAGKYIKDKFASILSFFGIDFGAEEEAQKKVDIAKRNVDSARKIENTFKSAGAIGKDDKGGIVATTLLDNSGRSIKEASEQDLISQGVTLLTEEERKALETNYEKRRKYSELILQKNEAELKKIQEAPKMTDFIPSVDDITTGLKGIGTSIWESITDAFDSITDSIKEVDISGFIGDAGNMASNFFKNILKGVLPSPDAMTIELPSVDTWFGKVGGGTINLNPIPDSIYEFAGLNPATGEDIVSAPSAKKAEALSSEMEMATFEQNQMKDIGSQTTNVVDASNNSNIITNNTSNSTIVAPAPNPVRQPNSPSETIWAGASVAP